MELMSAYGLHPNRLTNSWVPFVAASVRALRPGGRLGLVLPAELLQVAYAAQLRQFLVRNFRTIHVIACNELFFDKAEQEVVVFLADDALSSRASPTVAPSASRPRPRDGLFWARARTPWWPGPNPRSSATRTRSGSSTSSPSGRSTCCGPCAPPVWPPLLTRSPRSTSEWSRARTSSSSSTPSRSGSGNSATLSSPWPLAPPTERRRLRRRAVGAPGRTRTTGLPSPAGPPTPAPFTEKGARVRGPSRGPRLARGL